MINTEKQEQNISKKTKYNCRNDNYLFFHCNYIFVCLAQKWNLYLLFQIYILCVFLFRRIRQYISLEELNFIFICNIADHPVYCLNIILSDGQKHVVFGKTRFSTSHSNGTHYKYTFYKRSKLEDIQICITISIFIRSEYFIVRNHTFINVQLYNLHINYTFWSTHRCV